MTDIKQIEAMAGAVCAGIAGLHCRMLYQPDRAPCTAQNCVVYPILVNLIDAAKAALAPHDDFIAGIRREESRAGQDREQSFNRASAPQDS